MLAKMITGFAFYLFYWLCCFLGTGTDKKNLAGLRSYPDAVQQAVREHPVLGKAAPQEKSIVSILLGNLLLFTVVFSILGFTLKSIPRLPERKCSGGFRVDSRFLHNFLLYFIQ